MREVVAAVDLAGMSYAEAASALRIPHRDRDEPPVSRPARLAGALGDH